MPLRLMRSRLVRTAAIVVPLLGLLLVATPADGAPSTSAGAVATCAPDSLYVVKGRLDAGAGQRYLPIRVTNVGDDACVLPTGTKVRFRDFDGPLGKVSLPPSESGTITLASGRTVKTVVHWSDPGPVPPDQCDAAQASLVTLRLPALHHTWRIPLAASVCTTAEYRPDAPALK